MRNLKRTLSLVLAALMLMSMMVVGAGAATKDFTDSDEIQHKEAVEVMVALNVVSGKDDGSYFAPTDTFTREEMAKVVSYVMNGGVEPVVGTKVTPTYSDIKGIWSEKYIEYCTSMGIISGDGTGKFNPTGTLTAEQAAKMFLTAMGYDSKVFGFVGNDWAINVGRYANEAGLYKELGDVVPSQPITRDDAMQMAYNAIQGTMMRRTWSQDLTTGQLTETYGPWTEQKTVGGVLYNIPHTLLSDKFDGSIELGYLVGFDYDATKAQWTYTFNANANFGGDKINTQNALASQIKLKSTVDYTDLFGQQVKVIYNIDNNEVIYGVYANNSSVIVSGATGNVEEYNDTANTVTVAGTDYKLNDDAKTIGVYDLRNDVAVAKLDTLPTEKADGTKNANALDAYTFKMVDNTGDGKIDAVIRTPVTVAKINYVGKDSVQLGSNIGSVDLDDLVTYDGYAAGDWVCYIKDTYATTGQNTIQKLELQTAAVSGVRGGSGAAEYTEYQINGEWLAGSNYGVYSSLGAKADVHVTVEYIALGSTIFYAKIVDIAATSKNIAMVVTAGIEKNVTTSQVTGDSLKVKLLFGDGSTAVATASKLNGVKLGANATDEATLQGYIGQLVTYRMDGSNYELTALSSTNTAGYKDYKVGGGYKNGQVNGIELADDAVVYFFGSTPGVASSSNKADVYTGKEIKNTWGSDAKGDNTGKVQVLTQEVNGFTYAKVVLLIDATNGLPTVTTGSNYGYLSAPTYRSVDENGKTYLNYTIHTANGVLNVKEENTDAPKNYPQGSVVTYDVVSSDTVKNVNLARVTTGMVTGWDGVDKISLDNTVSEIDAKDTTVIYVDSNKMVGVEGGSIQKAADTDGNGTPDLPNVRYVLAANQVVLLLVDINNDMKEDPALSVLGPVLDSTSLTNAKIQENLDKYPVVTVNLSGAMSIGALTVPEGKTLAFTGTDTVTMSDNWVVNGTVTLEGALNLGGKDLSGTGTVTGDKVYLGSSISGSVTVTFKSAELLADFIINGGSLTINGNVTAAEGSNFSITVNGTAKLDAGAVTGSIVNNSTVKDNVQVDSVTGSVTGTGETDIYKISADTTAYIVNK
mgnify:CR=1 FL=1